MAQVRRVGKFLMTSVGNGTRDLLMVVGDLTVDAGTHQVTRAGREIKLPKLSFDLLLALVRAAPDMLTTDQLMQIVWSGRVVSNETVTQRVKLLRQAIGDDAAAPKYIGLVRGEGYRLLVDVRALPRSALPDAPTRSPRRTVFAAALIAAMSVALALGVGWWTVARTPDNTGELESFQPRLVVLPFRNLSKNADTEWFVDGLTEAVITELSHIPGLRVAGRTTSFAFKNRNPSVGELSQALEVSNVLEGSVRWENDSLLIAVQLSRSPTASISGRKRMSARRTT